MHCVSTLYESQCIMCLLSRRASTLCVYSVGEPVHYSVGEPVHCVSTL